jgi:nitrogen fixation protein NifQ
MIITAEREATTKAANFPLARAVVDDVPEAPLAAQAYLLFTGNLPEQARIEHDSDFDLHVLASLLAVSISEGGRLGERVGLESESLATLLAQWFPNGARAVTGWCACDHFAQDDEVEMVHDLLLAHRSTEGEVGRWLAAMIARRAMEPNHLWEDLGLRDRTELSRLLWRHFAPLASRNTKDMRWKRFFYRMLCEDDGMVMCTTPVCSNCGDFDRCFGEESGESRMAERRREVAWQGSSRPTAIT